MTDRTTLLALAERCEQASGPDAGLDLAIWKALSEMPGFKHPSPIWRFDVTASLDAVVTMVPEGWRYDLTNGDLVSEEKPAARLTPDFAGPCFDGYAQTAPRALCAAALRGWAAMG